MVLRVTFTLKTFTFTNVNGKEPLETTTPQLTQSTDWQDMSRPLYWGLPTRMVYLYYIPCLRYTILAGNPRYSGCEQDTAACERTWSDLASWTLRLQRRRTDGPPHPPGVSRLAETETPVVATGWVNHQQAVGNGGRPAPHHPIPGNMWTEGLSTADWPQKKY